MSIWLAIVLMIVGTALVLAFSGKLVTGTVGTSYGFGVSAFLISVIFIGFDPENLVVGAAGAYEEIAGIALGSVIGAAMVAFALAFGITALIAPMTFEQAPGPVLIVPVLAPILFGVLAVDGRLSRIDGALLLIGYTCAVGYLVWLSRRGTDIKAATKPRKAKIDNKWKAAGLLFLSLAAIVVGAELLVEGSETIIERLGVSDTFFGMVILALVVSVEEVARELPAAMKGHPEISFGNIVGSALAFFLFNGGLIALVHPVDVSAAVMWFYLPVCFAAILFISLLMLKKKIPRWAGAVLVLLYGVFVAGGYFVHQTQSVVLF